MEYPHLPNAPIREALIDLRCQLPVEVDTDRLLSLHETISSDYPEKRERKRYEGHLHFGDESVDSSSKVEIDGFQFLSPDSTQVVQYRLDGFTFSRLRPYETWERLSSEAKRLWKFFRDGTNPTVERVAVRYINELEIPLAAGEWQQFLSSPPSMPEDLARHSISDFIFRYSIFDSSSESTWLVTQALRSGPRPDIRSLMIDIDAFKEGDFSDEESLWNTLEFLRGVKNEIFFSTLSEKAIELCR